MPFLGVPAFFDIRNYFFEITLDLIKLANGLFGAGSHEPTLSHTDQIFRIQCFPYAEINSSSRFLLPK